MEKFQWTRRVTSPVKVGDVTIGGNNPVVVQSMTTTSTNDTKGSAEQTRRIVEAGGEIVRLTTQGVREAENLYEIKKSLGTMGVKVPLVADVHFNPRAAFAAAERVEKVRINPGNFVDPGRTFKKIEFTDGEYAEELIKIENALVPLLDLCKEHHTALRIGVNHGSLSDRIMSRYGDTPAGMVESAMEFLRVCVRHEFNDVVISIKASNVLVMTETVRRLVAAMDAEDMHFPLHLGVTEAGDGEDGRIKSAVGIGSLLMDGIGDTIRVSLSEEPEQEIPVAKAILRHIDEVSGASGDYVMNGYIEDADPFVCSRRKSAWDGRVTQVVGLDPINDETKDGIWADLNGDWGLEYDKISARHDAVVTVTADGADWALKVKSFVNGMSARGIENPVIVAKFYDIVSFEALQITAAVDFGYVLLSGIADAIFIGAPDVTREELNRLSLNILQATRHRISKTEFISCPGCGRTLYDLQSTLKEIKAATSHLKGLKIGVMGCIVNGPGEMADADYGYVGAGPGHISLYKGKECVVKNIPASEALPRLIALIKEHGDWVEP
ncbi:(E)-4-hydroxy-3-methylbut-2-enyl-diphosphate synthase [Duncaniella freteri]|jgi:(E)-4-hydroxy-3-methylbut-2-enyl-diphosphate synthase|uniref:4-hydroxy-3-methylbut-2-en-1-yl diphosphate synthase (flavodoxin) n=32 Tax=Duncaniella TaxID=2518495 RepID=A0A4Z0V5I6_9BACT|nr:(E)-4-hydroxy-3-methylbut-2-enyl-diphosphate synthase [Duncaniella freteri]TGG36711.1 4-hydroxy-3-methylbut-2-en-1-yl diphosphate synthase [Duncaniella freteri]